MSCQYNSRLWLEQQGLGDKIRLDRFKGIISVDDKPLDDTMIISMNGQIEASQRTRWSQEHVRSALIDIGNEHARSPWTDWLDTLQWDGESRLDLFFRDAYQCELDPYTTAFARVLFLSAVALAYQPGCQTDVMVVLIGPQGIFKSTGMKALCHDPSWFTDNIGDISDRKIGEDLQGKWIVEFSEFSRINRATADVTKGFLTRTSDWFRPAYGRVSKDHHLWCVFVGTSNTEELLQDTENRRDSQLTASQATSPGSSPTEISFGLRPSVGTGRVRSTGSKTRTSLRHAADTRMQPATLTPGRTSSERNSQAGTRLLSPTSWMLLD